MSNTVPTRIIEVPINKQVYIHDLKKSTLIAYDRLGNGSKTTEGIRSMNASIIISEMTKPELFVFGLMAKNKQWVEQTSLTKILLTGFSSSDVNKFTSGYKLLKDKGLLIRTKRSHFIYNPLFMVPKDELGAISIWNTHASEEFKIEVPEDLIT